MRAAILLAIICGLVMGLSACKIKHNYRPGGPYYFKGGVTYEGYFPNGEISKTEADALASQGYAYYTAYFNDYKLPTLIQKHYKGIITKTDLYYTGQDLIKVIETDSNCKVTYVEELFYINGEVDSVSATDRHGNKRWLKKYGKLIK